MLLMFVAAIPFITSTYAEYAPHHGMDAKVAVLLYGIVMEGMSTSFTLMFARLQRTGLIRAATEDDKRKLLLRYGIGHLIYPVITLICWFFPPLMLPLYGLVVAYYFGPGLRTLDAFDGHREAAPVR